MLSISASVWSHHFGVNATPRMFHNVGIAVHAALSLYLCSVLGLVGMYLYIIQLCVLGVRLEWQFLWKMCGHLLTVSV